VPERLFLCHHRALAAEIEELARCLRARGIVPWVDANGGFMVGDDSAVEARRAIREDCWGLLFYASLQSFDRPFIRHVEIPAALEVKRSNPSYTLFAVPRGITFEALRRKGVARWGVDLAAYNSSSFMDGKFPDMGELANKVLLKFVGARIRPGTSVVRMQLSTRDLMPDDPEDLLRIDLTAELATEAANRVAWDKLQAGLRHIKAAVASAAGRPRIAIHGSKHLTAALLAGRTFAAFDLDVRTAEGVWSSDGPIRPDPLGFEVVSSGRCDRLVVQIATATKNTSPGVDAVVRHWSRTPARLSFRPSAAGWLDPEGCRGAVEQIYRHLEDAQGRMQARELHLFAACPQALLMMLGKRMRGAPTIHMYEWISGAYQLAAVVPPGVL
jgi:hypothetical protein